MEQYINAVKVKPSSPTKNINIKDKLLQELEEPELISTKSEGVEECNQEEINEKLKLQETWKVARCMLLGG